LAQRGPLASMAHRAVVTEREIAQEGRKSGRGFDFLNQTLRPSDLPVKNHPLTRIAYVSFATLFRTLGTRFQRLIDGGRFSFTLTGISRMRSPARYARMTSSLANTSFSTTHASTCSMRLARRNAFKPCVSVPRKPSSVRKMPV